MDFSKFNRESDFTGVATHHPEYDKWSGEWEIIRDWVAGASIIKIKGEKYLPKALGMSKERYKAFVDRAVVVDYVAQTLDGTHGMIFRRLPVLKFPQELQPIIDNIDREGNNFYQFASDSVYDIMQTQRGGYLVDIPEAGEQISLYEAEQRGIRPYVTYYPAESIINWKTKVINGTKVPVLVVLKEAIELEAADEFGHELGVQYRVLDLGDGGYYRQRIYIPEQTEVKDGKPIEYEIKEIPFVANGQKIKYIPFVFAPSDNPDKPMLTDIAQVNIGHYKKSADYENAIHLTTIPTGYTTGATPQMDKNKNVMPLYLGGDAFLQFPDPETKVGTLCYAGEGLSHSEEALRSSELQMVVLGSRIITPERGMSETAESANIHRAGENAKLATFANNMSTKLTQVLNIICSLMGIEGCCEVRLNTDYETQGFDANALNSMANIFSQGKLPLIVLYSMLMKGEFLDPDMSYDDYVELLDLQAAGLTEKEIYEAYKIFKDDPSRLHIKPKAQPLPVPGNTDDQPKEETDKATVDPTEDEE